MKTEKSYRKGKRNTQKKICVNGTINESKEGWKTLTVYGDPYERGFAHGYLLKNELKRMTSTLAFLVQDEMNVSITKYLRECRNVIKPIIKREFPEFYTELEGIRDGAIKRGLQISLDMLIGWNSYLSMFSYFTGTSSINCSAFIATGKATEKGDMVMAHNTHTSFADGQLHNIIMNIIPSSGHPFVMQTSAGYIASGTDWFICSTGIIGCETTIGDINYKPKFGVPYFCRIRQAMQYGETLDDYDTIMDTKNAGDYACSWLFGDINTNEIMLYEIGLNEKSVQRTKNGVFYGMNSAMDKKLRENETNDEDHENITTSAGGRNFRLNELLNKTYKGKINMDNAKKVIADHYDTYLRRKDMNGRVICNHSEYDFRNCRYLPYDLFGCTDGKVVNTKMAKNMSFSGRFGSSCGRPFSIKKHIIDHPEMKKWRPHVKDFVSYDWVNLNKKEKL
jgi:hypothetical protein